MRRRLRGYRRWMWMSQSKTGWVRRMRSVDGRRMQKLRETQRRKPGKCGVECERKRACVEGVNETVHASVSRCDEEKRETPENKTQGKTS